MYEKKTLDYKKCFLIAPFWLEDIDKWLLRLKKFPVLSTHVLEVFLFENMSG